MEVLFDTYNEAKTQANKDYALWMSTERDPNYASTTKKWAEPIQRLDGKWSYAECPLQDYTGFTLVEYKDVDYYVIPIYE